MSASGRDGSMTSAEIAATVTGSAANVQTRKTKFSNWYILRTASHGKMPPARTILTSFELDDAAENAERHNLDTLKKKIQVEYSEIQRRDGANKSETTDKKIVLPPGYRMRDAFRIILGRKFVEGVIEPVLADMQYEYFEAIRLDREREARIIKWRGRIHVVAIALIAPVLKVAELLRRSIAG